MSAVPSSTEQAQTLAVTVNNFIMRAKFANDADRYACLAALDALQALVKPQWRPIGEQPAEGGFLWYMPDEPWHQMQVANVHPNVTVVGSSFAFDLTAPTHFQHLPTPPAP